MAHFGGDAIPFGPCASWQVAHPPLTEACALADSSLWHEAQVAVASRSPLWASWHMVHFWWPAGAVARSVAWHVPQAGAGLGWWAESPWQLVQLAWPALWDALVISRA